MAARLAPGRGRATKPHSQLTQNANVCDYPFVKNRGGDEGADGASVGVSSGQYAAMAQDLQWALPAS